ncbi:MAG TPA: STAS domain-containing protein [Gaiellaceae bacterium]|nr:STAS domain-containing protein [Gaiellaceae bacterium]
MSVFELEPQESGDETVALVRVSGELDLTNARELEQALVGAGGEAAALVLDLDRVAFMDSAALHVLFRLARQRGPHGLGLVYQPDASVARAVEIAGLTQAATVGASVEDVVAGLANG